MSSTGEEEGRLSCLIVALSFTAPPGKKDQCALGVSSCLVLMGSRKCKEGGEVREEGSHTAFRLQGRGNGKSHS